ncbi:UDP-N-acetylmuramoyl-tripeptide--D-alanyl-D-alanine ligase [Lysinibacillus sp. KU-BSD001]|uniref:Mur ligase family protein n=1 Tax=Lysinibacillus sp. KU-BSD001 TaxID=3141328 RepID=UPI0036E2A275
MKPLSVKQLCTIISGELVQGEEVIIQYGAYRLKQVKHKNTVLFIEKRIVKWKELATYFPIVLVTELSYGFRELPQQVTVIRVKRSEEAFWKFINYYRHQFQLPVVAITGTAGKTTTKEMVKHILTPYKKVTATQLSTNSRTAFLHYLLSIEGDTEAAVFETAVGAPGDLRKAGTYFKPTIGIITNIGAHHLNYCKTLEGYIEAKGEMVEIIDPNGTLIINAEDENTKKIDLQKFRGKIIRIGKDASCDFRASDLKYCANGMQFKVHYRQHHYDIQVPGFGEHQVYNALAAIAAVVEMGLTIPEAAQQLQTFKQLNKQLQLLNGMNGALLLDDTWSITTTSLSAALDVLNALANRKKRVAIIGTITDVGSWGYTIHEQAGELIYKKGVDVLITVGEHAKIIGDYAVKLGFQQPVYSFKNSILVYDLLKDIVDSNTIILIKGDMYSKTMIELASNLRKKS